MAGSDEVQPSGLSRPGFVELHGLWTAAQSDRARSIRDRIERDRITSVRVVFADQHGIARVKMLTARNFLAALERGHPVVSTLFAFDTANLPAFPVFTGQGGLPLGAAGGTGDLLMVPDPETFRVLPWVPATGWILSDLYLPDGAPVPIAPRYIYRRALDDLRRKGFGSMVGLEVEFYVMKLEDVRLRPKQSGQPPDPPQANLLSHGFQHLAEQKIDEMQPILETLLENLEALGLPVRSLETEWGPSQCEVTFEPETGLAPADDILLFRTAVKQICRRHGCHATFMCWPAVQNIYASVGICISRCIRWRPATTRSSRRTPCRCCRRRAATSSAVCCIMPPPAASSAIRPSMATSGSVPIRSRPIAPTGRRRIAVR